MGRGSGERRGGGVCKGGASRCSAGESYVGMRQCLRSRVWGSVEATGAVTGTVAGICVRGSVETVVTCVVWRGCAGAHRGSTQGNVRNVGRRG